MIQALYVDDEPDLLSLGKIFLERYHDMEIETEQSAEQALARLKSRDYDAIISDFYMPEMDGITFLKHVRSEFPKRIPFILFTGRGKEEVAIEALNTGADFYLQKGGDPKSQFAILRNNLIQVVEKVRAEDELKKSEERYRDIVEDQMEAICRFKPDGTHIFVNSAYCEFIGRSREELIGKKYIPEVPPEDKARLKNHFHSLTPENPKASIEQRIIMPDKTTRWIRCNDRALFDGAGKIREYQSVARDITKQKIAEHALIESEKRLQNIIDFLPDALYAIDLQGKIIVWNRAAEELTGIPAKDMLGRGDFEYAHRFYGKRQPVLIDLVLDPTRSGPSPYGKICKEGTALSSESILTRKDGNKIPLWIKAAPIYSNDGTVTGAIEAIRDTTSYKQMEERLCVANRKINLMSSVTRHGIINKLAILTGYLGLIDEKKTDSEMSQYLKLAIKTVTAIQHQIESTRAYQELGVKSPQWHDLNNSFLLALSHVDMKTVDHTCSLKGFEIYADPLLEQVFVNLIENSLQHGGNLTAIRCSGICNGNRVTIVYEDNGRGIPKDEKERIFCEGYGRHTGMGLFLARAILSITNITIQETGEPGQGSRFEIMVPAGAWRKAGSRGDVAEYDPPGLQYAG